MNFEVGVSYIQLPLLPGTSSQSFNYPFPSTRYQGSKRKLSGWIEATTQSLQFQSALDVFGGTGAVSHLFKRMGKSVIYNDNLLFNWNIGLALIQNTDTLLSTDDIETILSEQKGIPYPSFVQDTFEGIYFTQDENAWIDRVVYNIDHFLTNPIKQSIARFALFQACIIKRPYNLFHRANLYMREAQVERTFGNKRTWDTPFETHFRTFVEEANAAIFDNHRQNQSLNVDALETPTGADLVYIDPPYLNAKGIGVNYHEFYHFLEGLSDYERWPEHIDYGSKHRRLIPQSSVWDDPKKILEAFEAVIARHHRSILVVSYRDDGIPSKTDLIQLLQRYKTQVTEAQQTQQYALSTKNLHELLLIAV
jgi:adenine-specific DNA-methyltransferase